MKTIESCSADADGRRLLQSKRRHRHLEMPTLEKLMPRKKMPMPTKIIRHWQKEWDADKKIPTPHSFYQCRNLFVGILFFLSVSDSFCRHPNFSFSASASPVLASQDADADVAIAEIYARRRRHCKTLPWWGTIKHKWLIKLAISQQVLNIFPWFNVRRKAHYLPVLTHTQA